MTLRMLRKTLLKKPKKFLSNSCGFDAVILNNAGVSVKLKGLGLRCSVSPFLCSLILSFGVTALA